MVSFLSCLVAFLAFHLLYVLSFFKNVFLLLVSVAFLGGEKTMVVAVAQLRLAATYIATHHKCTTIVETVIVQRAPQTTARQYGQKIAGSRNIQHRKRGGY